MGRLTAWLNERRQLPNATTQPALLLTRQGRPLSERGIDRVVRTLGTAAGLEAITIEY